MEVQIATDRKQLTDAANLVYWQYLAAGLCDPHPFSIRVIPQHADSATDVLVGLISGCVVATLTLVRSDLPCQEIVSVQPGDVEACCFAMARGSVRQLFRFVDSREPGRIVSLIQSRHVKAYRRIGFEQIGEGRKYSKARGCVVVPMAWRREKAG